MLGALVGGAIALALTLYAAAQLLGRPADSPHDALGAMIRAEVGKLILAVVLISLAVMALPEQAAAIVTTLAATLSAYWLALLYTNE
jgi:F0F1-type ATP synthase assembly protein I